MIEVRLACGLIAMIDDEDEDVVMRHKWHVNRRFHTRYAITTARDESGKKKVLKMHRIIMRVDDPSVEVDHINGNGLDNRRHNLRLATAAQNRQNRPAQSNNTSGFKGVSRLGKKWRAYIGSGGELLYIGVFDSPADAALARDAKARELHGEFARLNFE
jgi:hypothetical protein